MHTNINKIKYHEYNTSKGIIYNIIFILEQVSDKIDKLRYYKCNNNNNLSKQNLMYSLVVSKSTHACIAHIYDIM